MRRIFVPIIALTALLSACGQTDTAGTAQPDQVTMPVQGSDPGHAAGPLSEAALQAFVYSKPLDEPDYQGTPENTEVVDVATGRSFTVRSGMKQLSVGKIAPSGSVAWSDGRMGRVPTENIGTSLNANSLRPLNIYEAFRRVISNSGYRKINAQITLPASVNGLTDTSGEAAYNYFGFSNSSNMNANPTLNAEFGLYTDCTVAQYCGKWLIYRRFGGAQLGQQPQGNPAVFNPSTQLTIRLFVSSEVDPSTGTAKPAAVFQYNVTGGTVYTVKYFNVPNLTTDASNLYLRRVSSLLLNKAGNTKVFWRNVSLSTASTTSPFTSASSVTTTSNVSVTNEFRYTDEDLYLTNP